MNNNCNFGSGSALPPKAVICCQPGSTAAKYAQKNGQYFESIKDSGNPPTTNPGGDGTGNGLSGSGTGANSVPKGTELTDSKTKADYTVTKPTATVEYKGTTNKKATSVSIPSTIKVGGVTYKVTGIAKNAFKNNKKLKKVIISGNVKSIGAGAFQGCTSLKKVSISAKVTKIGSKAFYNCKKLNSLTIKTKKLTTKNVGSKAFTKAGSSNYKKLKIKVPSGKVKAYKKLLKKKGLSPKVKVRK